MDMTKPKPDMYVDLGSHFGASIRRFYTSEYFGDCRISDPAVVKIFAFEPLFHGKLKENIDQWGYKNVEIIAKAAGTQDGQGRIYRGSRDGQGSTMVIGKTTGQVNYGKPIAVETVSFASWLYERVPNFNRVFVHMNVEGMEYAILPQLFEYKLWFVIDHLSVEFHGKKVYGINGGK